MRSQNLQDFSKKHSLTWYSDGFKHHSANPSNPNYTTQSRQSIAFALDYTVDKKGCTHCTVTSTGLSVAWDLPPPPHLIIFWLQMASPKTWEVADMKGLWIIFVAKMCSEVFWQYFKQGSTMRKLKSVFKSLFNCSPVGCTGNERCWPRLTHHLHGFGGGLQQWPNALWLWRRETPIV